MIADSIVRAFQIIFSVIVLALSIVAVRWQVYGKAPAASGYNAFAGAWGILTGLIGLAAVFVHAIPALFMGLADFLAFVILLAGGIAYAVQTGRTDCSLYGNTDDTPVDPYFNGLMNGGQYFDTDTKITYTGFPAGERSVLGDRCTKIKADTAFLFLACVASLVAGALSIVAHRRGRSYSSKA